jgi:hypothetical protein
MRRNRTYNPTRAKLVEAHRKDRAAIVAELDAAGAVWAKNGKDCCCPWHDDRNASAGIYQTDDGAWHFKCHTCNDKPMDVFDVQAKRENRPVADVLSKFWDEAFDKDFTPQKFGRRQPGHDPRAKAVMSAPAPATPAPPPPRADKRGEKTHFPTVEKLQQAACYRSDAPNLTLEERYDYTNPATGEVELVVFRLRDEHGKKHFKQGSPHGGGYVLAAPPGLLPIYNRTRALNATHIVVVEGERCVHALTPWLPKGWAAVTAPGGAGKAHLADWALLAGKIVYLWPDADPADEKTGERTGVKHMHDVADRLAALSNPPRSHWIDCDALGLPAKGDAADWLAAKRGAGVVEPGDLADAFNEQVLRTAEPLRPSSPLLAYYRDVAAGRITTVPWTGRGLSVATKALQPGRITCLCGEPGAGKSWFLVQSLDLWLEGGIPAACLMLELNEVFHANRLHGSLTGESGLLDTNWIPPNIARVEQLYFDSADRLDRFWRALDTVPRGQKVTAKLILDWLERRLRSGCRVAAADPYTAVADDMPWVTDVDFILAAQKLAEQFAASIILAVHPNRGGKKLARSEGLRRFVDTVIWIDADGRRRETDVLTPAGTAKMTFNRTVRVTKARLASGAGMAFAYDFAADLRFTEYGVLPGAVVSDDDDE